MQVHDTNIYIPPELQILTFAQLPSAPNAGISLVITAGKLIDTQCPVSRLSRAKTISRLHPRKETNRPGRISGVRRWWASRVSTQQ
jgi:hypothetical protein